MLYTAIVYINGIRIDVKMQNILQNNLRLNFKNVY